MNDTFNWDSLTAIAEKQNSYYNEDTDTFKPIKLSDIPELTYHIWRESIDYHAISESTNRTTIDDSPEKLSDGYCELLELSRISIDDTTQKRGKWYIMYDQNNDIYWKLEYDIDSDGCIIMEYWVNFVLND